MAKKLTPEEKAAKAEAAAKKAAEKKEAAAKKAAEKKPEVVKEGSGVFGQSVQIIRMKDKSMKVVNWKPTGEKVIDVTAETAEEIYAAECENPVISGE